MPKPSNPFGATPRGPKDGRGRGRGGTYQKHVTEKPQRNVNTTRGQSGRGHGRGTDTATRRGGGPIANSHSGHDRKVLFGGAQMLNSPFAQLKQGNTFGPSGFANNPPSQFGKPSFTSGGINASQSFGAPSAAPFVPQKNPAGSVDRGRDTRGRRGIQRSTPRNAKMSSVPVEDTNTVNAYQDRYERLKLDRAKQRERAVKEGFMADPNQPTSLNNAITPVGTCTSMCFEFERVERIVQKMVDRSEKFLHPTTNTYQNMESKMLKRFRRSAAGYDEQLPSDIRTPKTLLQTVNYLIRHVISSPEPLGLIHKFVWDRTRSVRNDFSVQQLTQEDDVRIAVTCLERIARFHIVSLHLLSSPENKEQFDHHQEREQLNNTLLSLMYYYDDNRGRIYFPNEAEFRAYYIVFAIHDQRPDLETRVQNWPKVLLQSQKVQVALELFAAASNTWEYQGVLSTNRHNVIAQGIYTRFFNLVNSPSVSYLMACVAEIYFNNVRETAIQSIWKAYCRQPASQQSKNYEWTLEELTQILFFDDESQTEQFCLEQGLPLSENESGELYLDWGSRPINSVVFQSSIQHAYSDIHVENKRGGRTLAAIILGLNISQAASHGMIDSSLVVARPSPSHEDVSEASEDEALFVSEKDNTLSQPVSQMNGNLEAVSDVSESVSNNQSVSDFEKPQTLSDLSQQPAWPATSVYPTQAAVSTSHSPPVMSQPFSIAAAIASETPASATSQPEEKTPSNVFDLADKNSPKLTTPSFSFTPTFPTSHTSSAFSRSTQNSSTSVSAFNLGSSNVSPVATSATGTTIPNSMSAPVNLFKPSTFQINTITANQAVEPDSSSILSAIVPNFSPVSNALSPVRNLEPPTVDVNPTMAAAATETTTPSEVSPPVSDYTPTPDSAESRKAWVDALHQSMGMRRVSPPSRKSLVGYKEVESMSPEESTAENPKINGKRPLEVREEQSPSLEEDSPRVLKISKTGPARSPRLSLARASIAPLPSLPILDEVEKMTAKKQPSEVQPDTPRHSYIDEDERLLSAARIMAEKLKSGPSLLGNMSEYSYPGSIHSPQRIASRVSSVSDLSRSQSPYARINGYDVALAPETSLGLGRTLSRTEQRLRLTGGKGLAYKQLTPERPILKKKKAVPKTTT